MEKKHGAAAKEKAKAMLQASKSAAQQAAGGIAPAPAMPVTADDVLGQAFLDHFRDVWLRSTAKSKHSALHVDGPAFAPSSSNELRDVIFSLPRKFLPQFLPLSQQLGPEACTSTSAGAGVGPDPNLSHSGLSDVFESDMGPECDGPAQPIHDLAFFTVVPVKFPHLMHTVPVGPAGHKLKQQDVIVLMQPVVATALDGNPVISARPLFAAGLSAQDALCVSAAHVLKLSSGPEKADFKHLLVWKRARQKMLFHSGLQF